jgi:hypothetical protein
MTLIPTVAYCVTPCTYTKEISLARPQVARPDLSGTLDKKKRSLGNPDHGPSFGCGKLWETECLGTCKCSLLSCRLNSAMAWDIPSPTQLRPLLKSISHSTDYIPKIQKCTLAYTLAYTLACTLAFTLPLMQTKRVISDWPGLLLSQRGSLCLFFSSDNR